MEHLSKASFVKTNPKKMNSHKQMLILSYHMKWWKDYLQLLQVVGICLSIFSF
jgi:hypothetical protein